MYEKDTFLNSCSSWLEKVKLICSLVDWTTEASAVQACCPRMNNVPLSQTVYIVFRLRSGNLHVSNKIITNFVNHNIIIRVWVQSNKIMTFMVNNGFVYHKPHRLWILWEKFSFLLILSCIRTQSMLTFILFSCILFPKANPFSFNSQKFGWLCYTTFVH